MSGGAVMIAAATAVGAVIVSQQVQGPMGALPAITGTGFVHVTGGAIDAAARAVNLATGDVTGLLPVASLSTGTNAFVLTMVAGVPTWAAATGGITQLTADVLAGPGSGSVAATVVALQGTAVSATVPVTAQLMACKVGPTWTPVTIAGDLTTGSSGPTALNFQVLAINGATVPAAGALTTGNSLHVSGVSALTYQALNLAGGAGWVTGALPVGNIAPGSAAQFFVTNAGATAPAWVSMSGDAATTAAGAVTVSKVNGTSYQAAGALTTGNGPYVSGASATIYSALNLAGGAGWVTGVLPVANLPSGTPDWTGAITSNAVVQITGSGGICTLLTATSLLIKNAGTTPSTTGRLNVDASVANTLLAAHDQFNAADLPLISNTASGSYFFGINAASVSYVLFGANGNYFRFIEATNGVQINATKASAISTPFFFDSGSDITLGATTADKGGGAGGIFDLAPVTTIPTAFPSTHVGVYATGQSLGLNAKGILFPLAVTASIAITQTALASAAAPGTTGVTLSLVSQAGQQATGANAGGTGGILNCTAGAGGISASNTGGTGGALNCTAGAGGTGSTNGPGGTGTFAGGTGPGAGAGGNANLNGGSSQTGTNGLSQMGSAGTYYLSIGATGLNLSSTTQTIATSGNTTIAASVYVYPIIRINAVTLVGAATITLPNVQGFWIFDISQVASINQTLAFKSGTATSPTISTLGNLELVMVATYGGNTISINV